MAALPTRRPIANNSRLRLSSFRSSHLLSSLAAPSDSPGVALADSDYLLPDRDTDSAAEHGLLMAVSDPDAQHVYGEADADSDAEGDQDVEEAEADEYWSDAVEGTSSVEERMARRGIVHAVDAGAGQTSPVLEDDEPEEDEEDVPPPPRIELDPALDLAPSPPRLSTASEPITRRRSFDVGNLAPPRLSADAAMESRDGLLPSRTGTTREERERRRRSLDPRRMNGLFGFTRQRSSERLEPSVQPPPVPPLPQTAPPTTQPMPSTPPHSRARRATRSRSRSPGSSPAPAPVPPPPPLPPPTLSDLGLILKPLTPVLAPTHPSQAPTSGCLLSPGYLLLCHADGLDAVPLYAPPACRAYALIRGVPFRSVLVMDSLGFLVAIAGRREGVRVYALSDVRRAVEMRMEVERERERSRRKSVVAPPIEPLKLKKMPSRPDTPASRPRSMLPPPSQSRAEKSRQQQPQPVSPTSTTASQHHRARLSALTPSSLNAGSGGRPRSRRNSSSSTVSMPNSAPVRSRGGSRGVIGEKEWIGSESEDEVVEVDPEEPGSSVLDRDTDTPSPIPPVMVGGSSAGPPSFSNRPGQARRRPANLHLSPAPPHPHAIATPSLPSPNPSLMSMRQALATTPTSSAHTTPAQTPTGTGREVISFVDALIESRLPDSGPPGTRLPSAARYVRDGVTGAVTVVAAGSSTPHLTPPPQLSLNMQAAARSAVNLAPPQTAGAASVRSARRRWSVLDGIFTTSPPASPTLSSSNHAPPAPEPPPHTSQSYSQPQPQPRSSSLVPRIITTAFKSRSTGDAKQQGGKKHGNGGGSGSGGGGYGGGSAGGLGMAYGQPPKLEHIKLEGTRNAFMIKAVQTSKKSFLAILCGEDGKKVELFTGSSRTASLSLARTFILPDSPISLELQIQGEDLAELFLIFPDSVFALEPASVRVRQVNIARAERRAARRRRERERAGSDAAELGLAPSATRSTLDPQSPPGSAALAPPPYPSAPPPPPALPVPTPAPAPSSSQQAERDPSRDRRSNRRRPRHDAPSDQPPAAVSNGEARSRSSPPKPLPPAVPAFTTFQQLSFSPTFPLGTLAEDWIIPPTYPSFTRHKEWLQDVLVDGETAVEGAEGMDITQPSPEDLYHLWNGYMNSWPRRSALPEGLIPTINDASKVTLQDYFLPPISLLTQPAHYGPPCLFFCSRGGTSTAIVDHKGKSVLLDKFHWSSPKEPILPSRLAGGLGDIQRVEAFDGASDGAVLVAIRDGGLEAVDIADALLSPSADPSLAQPGSFSRRMNWTWNIADPFPTTGASMNPTTTPSKETSKMNGTANHRGSFVTGWPDLHHHTASHIFYLGREGNKVYLCMRIAGTFRILLLQSLLA